MESKEGLKVSVEETADIKEPFIKDFGFGINTGQSGVAEFTTPIINGKLAAVIVDADKQVGISIGLDEMEDILIWKDVNFVGQKFLSLRAQPIHNDGLVLKNEHTKWSLNDRLKMKVKGPFNTTVNFIVRYY